jgi:hypothetical protein
MSMRSVDGTLNPVLPAAKDSATTVAYNSAATPFGLFLTGGNTEQVNATRMANGAINVGYLNILRTDGKFATLEKNADIFLSSESRSKPQIEVDYQYLLNGNGYANVYLTPVAQTPWDNVREIRGTIRPSQVSGWTQLIGGGILTAVGLLNLAAGSEKGIPQFFLYPGIVLDVTGCLFIFWPQKERIYFP